MKKLDETIDSLVNEFNDSDVLTKNPGKHVDTHDRLTMCIPKEYKARYDELQEMSGRKFGKVLQQIIKQAIDKVK